MADDESNNSREKTETDQVEEKSTIETWEEYWADEYDNQSRRQLDSAIKNPLCSWLLVDVGAVLTAEIDVTFGDIKHSPDEVITTARDGFHTFVQSELDAALDTELAEKIPVHFIGISTIAPRKQLTLTDPLAERGRLARIPDVSVTNKETTYQAIKQVYRCPAGHETVLSPPVYSTRSISLCGEKECSNEVFVDESRTLFRPTVTFEIEYRGDTLSCVGTGLYAQETDRLDASQLHLTGIPRVQVTADGSGQPVYEISNVKRVR